ncbi:hypothetical protein AB0D10_05070 [Kitasatospora sp. NPDC048545]|jgi:hypothetical protein|uniref:hypothetical protein n=1 Tax=Kitasatospora sp. NPDC048545 TaxID=3157208 RepID=UPI0033C6FE21
MARLALTATSQPKTGAASPLNLTALLTAGTLGANTGVSFVNTGREVLHISMGAGASTVIVNIGTTIEGQSVTAITASLTSSATNIVGPFPSDENQPNGQIYVDFGTPASVNGVALLQNAGVF